MSTTPGRTRAHIRPPLHMTIPLLAVFFVAIAALAGAGLVRDATAEPIDSGSAPSGGADAFEKSCINDGGEAITIEDGNGNAVETSCSFGVGAETCNWTTNRCSIESVAPTPSGPLDDVVAPGDSGGVIVDETPAGGRRGDTVAPGSGVAENEEQPVGTSAQQVADPVEAVTVQATVCESLGGTATVDASLGKEGNVVGTSMTCAGGFADGLECYNGPLTGPSCGITRTHPEEGPAIPPTVGIEVVDEPVPTPATNAAEGTPATGNEAVEPTMAADEPRLAEPVATDAAEPTVPAEQPTQDAPRTDDEAVEPTVGAEDPGQ